MSFTNFSEVATRPLFTGVAGRYAHGARLTVGEVDLAAGAVVSAHQHLHEQVTYVMSGRVEFTVGNDTKVLEPGTCVIIPGDTPHACRALSASRVLDLFAPARDDFR